MRGETTNLQRRVQDLGSYFCTDHLEQGLLTSYFSQLAARALARLRDSPHARSWRLSEPDRSPWSFAGGLQVAFRLVVSLLSP